MESITRNDLVDALTVYYKEAAAEPDAFTDPGDPAEDAENAVDYIFEIAKRNKEGV